jgi:phosphate acetyltransferase
MIGRPLADLRVGDGAELTRVAGPADIAAFVQAVGDHNPLHADRTFAAATPFADRVAPGLWTAGLISAVIGTRLPGPGAVYLHQDLRFLRPVMFGDAVTARVEVLEVQPERNRVRLRTVCLNQRGEQVLAGEAVVMPPRARVVYAEPVAPALWALGPWAWALPAAAWGLGLAAAWGRDPAAARG